MDGGIIYVKFHPLVIVSVVAAVVSAGCATAPPAKAPTKIVISEQLLASNLRTIQGVAPHLNELDAEFDSLPRPGKQGREFFIAQEVEEVESWLFRFLAIQTTLWDMVDGYGGLDADFPADVTDTKAHVLSITATLMMASHTAFVVARAAGEPLLISQLNEAYFRSEIPHGSFDRMRVTATAPNLLRAVAEIETLFASEIADPKSPLSVLAAADADYADLIARIPTLQKTAEARLQQVARIFPSHTEAEAVAREDEERQHKTLYAIRAFVFKEVSRLKNPSAHVVVFTDAQKKEIFSLLKPGDLVLTYTAGYMSDVFIPGVFKHGITYIGTPVEREPMHLSADVLTRDDRFNAQEVAVNLQKSSLPNGTQADMIEAVAEGVIFNDLEHIMDTHVNRMLVLRPRLNDEERAAFLVEVYSYLGDDYDFRFDFADASKQVCTEVIYRAINGKGSINFALTVRGGHETLSADDIANYHLNSEAFEFVLLVETDPDSKDNGAIVLAGPKGEVRLEALMNASH